MASINLEEAERALQAAKKQATDAGVKLSISVVDARGDLICMVRMDGAPWQYRKPGYWRNRSSSRSWASLYRSMWATFTTIKKRWLGSLPGTARWLFCSSPSPWASLRTS